VDDNRAALIDRAVINQRRSDVGAELIPEIINAYLAEIPSRVETIIRAVPPGDFSLLEKEAHTLKSSSASVGAMRLADIAKDLECAGREQDLRKIEISIKVLTELSDQTRDALLALT